MGWLEMLEEIKDVVEREVREEIRKEMRILEHGLVEQLNCENRSDSSRTIRLAVCDKYGMVPIFLKLNCGISCSWRFPNFQSSI